MLNNTLIISDLHHRISGVSASIRSLLPLFTKTYEVTFLAKQPHDDIEAHNLRYVARQLRALHKSDTPIWHVRRNNEMFWGMLARRFVNRRLKLVFTSAAIRRHSAWPRFLISQMDAVIATSSKAAELVPNVHAIVPHGIDIERFSVGMSVNRYPWERYDLAMGIVGRVRSEKGTDLFSQSICELMPLYPNSCAVIVGKTTAKYQAFLKKLRNQWQQAGIEDRVFVVDEVALKDMPAIYQTLDIVCAPALYEGFGLVPIEAMVSGTAIVASRTGAYPDMITPGVNGYIVDCGSQDDLTNAISELLADPSKISEFKINGKQVVREGFTLESEAEGIMNVYHTLWSKL